MQIPTPKCRQDLDAHVRIAEVSSEREGASAWTVLGLYWRADASRPYVSVVEGRSSPESGLVNRFRATAHGTLSRALERFDHSPLRDRLLTAIPLDVAEHYPDGDTIRQREAAKRRRGYEGLANLHGVMEWLYPHVAEKERAAMLAADFGIQPRTVLSAINRPASGWVKAFIASMRHFDRNAWERSVRRELRGESTPVVKQDLTAHAQPLAHAGCAHKPERREGAPGWGQVFYPAHWRCDHGHKDFCPVYAASLQREVAA